MVERDRTEPKRLHRLPIRVGRSRLSFHQDVEVLCKIKQDSDMKRELKPPSLDKERLRRTLEDLEIHRIRTGRRGHGSDLEPRGRIG
jgi:hypothetical protein